MSNDTLTLKAAVLVELNRSHKKKQTALQTTVIIAKKGIWQIIRSTAYSTRVKCWFYFAGVVDFK